MPGRSTPLSNYPVVRSSDPELVRDRLFQVYGANSFDLTRSEDEFAITADHLQVGGVGLSYVEYIGDASVGFGEVSFVRQLFSMRSNRSDSIFNPATARLRSASNSTRCGAI
jgi:hypothetical protein